MFRGALSPPIIARRYRTHVWGIVNPRAQLDRREVEERTVSPGKVVVPEKFESSAEFHEKANYLLKKIYDGVSPMRFENFGFGVVRDDDSVEIDGGKNIGSFKISKDLARREITFFSPVCFLAYFFKNCFTGFPHPIYYLKY